MYRELLLVALVALAGCAVPTSVDHALGEDPPTDRLGWEAGYWYDDPVAVTPGDGLNESERRAVVARTMARLEQLRDLEFEATVPVEVISRAEYRNRSGGGGGGRDRWNDQVWEALLLVGEDSGSSQALGETRNATVQGYYSPSKDQIVVVSETETPTIDRRTLSHELVHALQDQQFGLNGSARTQDRQLARQGVIEGEANYLQYLYQQRCGNRWDCLDRPTAGGEGSGDTSDDGDDETSEPSYNRGVFAVLYQPYATGPRFVHQIREEEGWAGVDRLHDRLPRSSEQVIHPEKYRVDEPVNVTVPDRSNDRWSRFDHDPVADTVGEASIYAMFAANDAVQPENRFSYRSEPSAGWGGDSLVPYRNGSGGYGYVWTTVWDTEEDAREFVRAYRSILEERASERPSESVYVLPESDPFGDAFRVTRSGKRVRIVNGPDVAALDGIHDTG
ncbi:MAG: Hvo_1808 family surface protein [Haloarculaceae archaeon]